MSLSRPLWPALSRFTSKCNGSTSKRAFSKAARREAAWGFIGLGRMGYPMAKNLRAKIPAEDTLLVRDVNLDATTRFIEEIGDSSGRTRSVSDVREVAEGSDTIITVLPEPSHVSSVFDSILNAPLPPAPSDAQTPRLFIDCSTIDPPTSRDIAGRVSTWPTTSPEPSSSSTSSQDSLQDLPCAIFVDAPMSGGVVGAEKASLTFMLGCSHADQLPRVHAALELLGRRVVHLGDQGSGLSGKLANNYLLALNNIATCEAMALGIRSGLDARALAGLINSATGKCWPSEMNNPVPGTLEAGSPADRNYEGGFGLELMKKDLRLAIESAKVYGATSRLGDEAQRMYNEAASDGRCQGRDFSVVYRWLGGPSNGD